MTRPRAGALPGSRIVGEGPPVILIMGRGASGDVWRAYQEPAFTAAGFSVITFDNRGVGARVGETVDGGMAAMVEDVLTLQAEQGSPVSLVGTSLGARIALEVALAAPGAVTSVAAAAAHGRLTPVQLALSRGAAEADAALAKAHPGYFAALTAALNLSPGTLADPARSADWLALLRHGAAPGPGVAWQARLDDDEDRLAAYRRIAVPVLALGYRDDRVIPAAQVREVAAAIPGARYAELHDAGHFGYLEQPAEFNRIIIRFLEETA